MMVWAKIADAAIALVLLLFLVWGSDIRTILGICLALQVVTALGDALSFMVRQALDAQIREQAKRLRERLAARRSREGE